MNSKVKTLEKATKVVYRTFRPKKYRKKTLSLWWNLDDSALRKLTKQIVNIYNKQKLMPNMKTLGAAFDSIMFHNPEGEYELVLFRMLESAVTTYKFRLVALY